MFVLPARIEDHLDDECEDNWTATKNEVTYPLTASRWWSRPGELDEDVRRACMGINCNIWERSLSRRNITHELRGGGKKKLGYAGLWWIQAVQGSGGPLGEYKELCYLSKKVANFLHEFHADLFASLSLPLLPVDRSNFDVHSSLNSFQVASLLERLELQDATRGKGHFRLFGSVDIGHVLYPGVQRVHCWPFKELLFYGCNRQDLVFIRPPGVGLDFIVTPSSVWYARVKLLFNMSVETDMDPPTRHFECALLSLCYNYKLSAKGKLQAFIQFQDG
jgi:hypothetical protein